MHLRRLFLAWFALSFTAAASAAGVEWMSDLEAAKAKAAQEKKPLLIEFTGSTWCPPCKALKAQVLGTPEFEAFARDKVLVMLDYPPARDRTPEKVKANPQLAALMALKDKYQAPGFPTMVLLDASGKQQAKVVGYDGKGPKGYLEQFTKP